jgi:hypothetical protein
MSLKAFHLIFIAASLLMSLAIGVWGVERYLSAADGGSLALAMAGLVLGAALAVYAAKIRAKFKELPE